MIIGAACLVVLIIGGVFVAGVGTAFTQRYASNHHFLNSSTAAVFETIDHELNLPYRLYVPADRGDGKPLPLLLFLHGAGDKGDNNTDQTRDAEILDILTENAKYPCVLLAPQCPTDGYWSGADSSRNPSGLDVLAAVKDLITSVQGEYNVDSSRLYITGFSMGGYGVYGMLAKYPTMFACAVPCAGWAEPADYSSLTTKTPIWAFHGVLDTNIKVWHDMATVGAIRKNGGNVKLTSYLLSQHDCWDRAYADPALMPWIFSH